MDPSSSHTKLHSWCFSVRAKSKFFDLKLSASNVFPSFGKGGEKISLLLRFRRFLSIQVKSENRDPSKRVPYLGYRVFWLAARLFRRQPKKRSARRSRGNATPPPGRQGYIAAAAGKISPLHHSAFEKHHKGITAYALSFFIYLVFLFKMRKIHLPLLLVAIAVSFIGIPLGFFNYTCTDLVTNAVWKAWNKEGSLCTTDCFGFTLIAQVLVRR